MRNEQKVDSPWTSLGRVRVLWTSTDKSRDEDCLVLLSLLGPVTLVDLRLELRRFPRVATGDGDLNLLLILLD